MPRAFTAKRLPKHAGRAAWNAILGPQGAPNVLENDKSCDVAIIGGGFAGLSAARRYSQLNRGARIVVLEAGRIAEGASGRNSGFMIDLPHELASNDYASQETSADSRIITLNRMAIAFAKDAVREYGINPAYFDPAGKVNGAATLAGHRQNVSYAKHLKGLNEGYEMLDAQAMRELTGSRHYRSGLYTPGTVMLQPAGYIRGLAAGLTGIAEVFENSPVLSFSRQGSGWTIKTPQATVTTNRIIIANNGHLESFGFARGRLMHVFLFACMTKALDSDAVARLGGQPRWGITPSDPMGTTMRRINEALGGNRIATRTVAVFRPDMQTSQGQMQRAARVMRRKFDTRFPQLAGTEMEFTWAGHLCLSKNSVSIARELDKNVFSACCQNGLGTARGTLTGIAAAEMASGKTGPVSDYFRRQPEPSRLPPEPLASFGANAFLRWREWKARME